ncbi:bifunctional DNA primase/polymerase [Candidatus Manganitrophus noduliformans]|uniref:AAA family ATPase n=1 Tax=Candidatus Manganitrophus noduliformans TaxID=2606439 RepID=A0A7X6DMB3_9BACT|nr:bifunctional DNA primase/polymerase [Candidatus Manganitrophus noduliformans]NKE69867.1 AAA family ATPase [Candidatus Manganitrophus noduliformans]
MAFLEEAKKYLLRGWSVVPLEAKGKKPLISWKEYQERQATVNEIESWFKWENNIGIVTGKISGITVIDCDSPAAIDLASKKGLPTCPTVKTGKGYHFYYAYEPGVGNFQKRDDLPGIDLRGDGGFVVAPPSIHPSGAVYSWEGETRDLPPLPKWILRDGERKSSPGTFTDYFQGAQLGSRNDTLARMTGFLAKNIPYQDALEFALVWNTKNNPPLPHDEIERTVLSIYRLEGIARAKKAEEPAAPTAGPVIEDEEENAKEVLEIDDLSDGIDSMYEEGLPPGESTGWKTLDPHYTVHPGQITIVTGIPGHGKSEFIDALMVNLVTAKQWKFAIFSAESKPDRHSVGLIEKFVGMPFGKGPSQRMDKLRVEAGKEFLRGRFFFLEPSEKHTTLDWIIEQAGILVAQKGINGLLIDPWNELEHKRSNGVSETEYISQSLSKLRRFRRRTNVHVFLVAHPQKLNRDSKGNYPVPTLYDISGSAHWRNKADSGVCVWRDVAQERSTQITKIYIQKIKTKETGKVGVVDLIYDRVTGRYSDKPWDHGL